MLKHLKLHNLGPAPALELTLRPRLNIITGDNGLGKSFLLNVALWTMTRKWPAEINPLLTAGQKAIPRQSGEASIDFSFSGKSKDEQYLSTYQRREQAWTGRSGSLAISHRNE